MNTGQAGLSAPPFEEQCFEKAASELQQQVQRQQDEICRLREQLELERLTGDSWRKRLEALLIVSETTSGSLFTNQIFQTIAKTVLEITGYDGMGLGIYHKEKRAFQFVALRGLPDWFLPGAFTPIKEGDYSDVVIQTLQPAYTSDFWIDPRSSEPEKALYAAGMRSLAFIPAIANGELMGILGLHSKERIDWNPETLRWLTFIGREIGLLLQIGQYSNQLRERAALDEREYLSWELHDDLVQVLGSLFTRITLIQTRMSRCQLSKAEEELKVVKDIVAQTFDNVRDLIAGLRIAPNTSQDLLAILKGYIEAYSLQHGIDVTLDSDGWTGVSLPIDQNAQVIRIIQEALTNIRKHTDVTRARVSLKAEGKMIIIEINDNGQGFLSQPEVGGQHQSLGLATMRARARRIGGVLDIQSLPGKGTRIALRFPHPGLDTI